jgi:hypothetical protein
MPRFRGKLRHIPRCSVFAVMAALLLMAIHQWSHAALTMQEAPQAPSPQGQNVGRPTFGQGPEPEQDPLVRRAQREAEKKRNIERQQHLVTESNRILQLAMELSDTIDASGKAPPLADAQRKADEIEKLAKSVETRMKAE